MKIDYQDRIDDYLLDRMSDEAKEAFERDLEKNEELREQTEFAEDVQTAIKSRNEKLAKMGEWRDDYEWEDGSSLAAADYRATGSGYDYCPPQSSHRVFAKPRSSGFFYWLSGIAAVFVVGFFLFKTMFDGVKYEIQYNPSQMESRSIRNGGDYVVIERLLIGKDYDNALIQIEREEKEIAELRAGTDTVINEERRIYDQMFKKMKKDELTWLKVYALLGVNRHEEAIQLLDQLRESDGEYKEKADSLYNLIKR